MRLPPGSLLQATRDDSDTPAPIVTTWFKRLVALCNSHHDNTARHCGLQLVVVSVSHCAAATFCEYCPTWATLATKQLKASVPPSTQALALLLLQDLVYFSQQHNELRRTMASTTIAPLLKTIISIINDSSSSVTLVKLALATAKATVHAYPGASKSSAGKLRQACQNLFASRGNLKKLASQVFAATARCVTSKQAAEHWASLLQDTAQGCMHLLSELAPGCVTPPKDVKLPMPTFPPSQPSRQLSMLGELQGLLLSLEGLLRLDFAVPVSMPLPLVLNIAQACLEVDATACAQLLHAHKAVLLAALPSLHKTAVHLLRSLAGTAKLALLPISRSVWQLLWRAMEVHTDSSVVTAIFETATTLMRTVAPGLAVLPAARLREWVVAACKHTKMQQAEQVSMLSGNVDAVMSGKKGKRKQASSAAATLVPIGFCLSRPGEQKAAALAALNFVQALVPVGAQLLTPTTLNELHVHIIAQAAGCQAAQPNAPFDDDELRAALLSTLSTITVGLHRQLPPPTAQGCSLLAAAADRDVVAGRLSEVDAVVRPRMPGLRNTPAQPLAREAEEEDVASEQNDAGMDSTPPDAEAMENEAEEDDGATNAIEVISAIAPSMQDASAQAMPVSRHQSVQTELRHDADDTKQLHDGDQTEHGAHANAAPSSIVQAQATPSHEDKDLTQPSEPLLKVAKVQQDQPDRRSDGDLVERDALAAVLVDEGPDMEDEDVEEF